MLAYLDVVGHDQPGAKTQVEDLRWVWEPLMLAIATTPGGGMLIAWHDDWAIATNTETAANLAMMRGGLVAMYNITVPLSLDIWLRERWAERGT
jgi:hypothetical protein